MKKKITVIIALFCIISMLVAFAGCAGKGNDNAPGGATGSGQQSGNEDGSQLPSVNESQQFKKVISAVLNEFSSRLKAKNVLLSSLATEIVSGENVGFEKSEALQEIFDYMGAVEDKESIEEKSMNEIAIKNFVAVLAYGELIDNSSEADKIYGVPIEIKMSENTSPSSCYAVILSEGNHIVVYLYGKDDAVGEVIYKYDIDYISDSEFSAKMITLNISQPDVDDAEDSGVYYFYGDTDGAALMISGNLKDEDNCALSYKSSDGDASFRSDNIDAFGYCYSKVKSQYGNIDFDLIRSLKDTCQNSVTEQEFKELADLFCEKYGIE
ncbi:MAG: hypothetical protein K2O35_05665 [Clostridia bacterium]|nr:hypothetical protein [Clostridia bacterium]